MHEGKHGIIDQWDEKTELFADAEIGKASRKKGSIILKKNNYLKVTYSHRNSEPEGIGIRIVDWIRSAGAEAISEYFDKVKVIREEEPMTPEQRESYRKYVPEKLWNENMTWPQALAWTKNAVAPLKDGYPWLIDYSGFNGVWINRWRYIIDLDTNEFVVILAGMEMLCQEDDKYSKDFSWPGAVVHTEVGRYPLDSIPRRYSIIRRVITRSSSSTRSPQWTVRFMSEREVILEAKDVTKIFRTTKGRPLTANDKVSLKIYKGETLGIAGESGCGKSTFIRMVSLLEAPSSGEILFRGENVAKTKYARLARSTVLKIKQRDYIAAAQTTGSKGSHILSAYLIPNALPTLLTTAMLDIGTTMLSVSSLSFLGFGIQPPTPEWGYMLSEGRSYIQTAPWLMVYPGLSILITVVAFNLLGDSIRDILDPGTRRSHKKKKKTKSHNINAGKEPQ